MSKVVGLDGCRDGWIAAVVEDGCLRSVEYHKSASLAIDAHADATIFAFDIPIGLSNKGLRAADTAARRILRGRKSSVFNAPPLAAIDATTYAEASRVSKLVSGRGLTRQSFNLFPKIRDVAAVAGGDDRIYEAHPEVSFLELAGGDLPPPKKTWDGVMRRRALLSSCGLRIPDVVGNASSHSEVDDIADAMVCAWTAGRITSGNARPFPNPAERIKGRAVAIWC